MPEQVVIVDSSTTTATRDVVEAHVPSWPSAVLPTHVTSKPSLTHQRNVGIGCTASDVVLFVDDDVRLDANYVAEVLRVFEEDDLGAIGGVGGFIVSNVPHRVGALDRWAGFDSDREGVVLPSGRNTLVATRPEGLLDVEWLSGAAMSYRRSMLEREPPDEIGFPFEAEDVDLSYRVGRHGRLVVTPDAWCVHVESQRNRVSGAAQAEAELSARLRRVAAAPDRLSMRAAKVAAVYQLVKYTVSGVATLSRRRLAIARGTFRALRGATPRAPG
jgi:GT2 family glycosyltransferase